MTHVLLHMTMPHSFREWLADLFSHQQLIRDHVDRCVSSPKVQSEFLMYAAAVDIKSHLILVQICISLITNKVEQLFTCLCTFMLRYLYIFMFFHFSKMPLTCLLPSFPLGYLFFSYSFVGVP